MLTIVNFMPVYHQAPVSLHLLKADVAAAAERIRAAVEDGDDLRVLVPACETALADELRCALGLGADAVIEADPLLGFVYENDTACVQVTHGEKPIPSDVGGNLPDVRLIPGSELLGAPGVRTVWIEGADAPVELPEACAVADVCSAAGVAPSDAKAVYVGFPSGALVSAGDGEARVELGSDYVRVLTKKDCAASVLLEILSTYRQEGCGRCVYGHEGTYQLATIVGDICRKKGQRADLDLMRDLAPVMATQSLCEVGRAAGRTTASFIELFGDEIEAHITKKACAAGACKAFMTYHILPDKCVGCGECVDACEEDAILGKARFIYVIDQKACVQCGACVSACDEGAIIQAGAEKPRTPPRPIPIRRR